MFVTGRIGGRSLRLPGIAKLKALGLGKKDTGRRDTGGGIPAGFLAREGGGDPVSGRGKPAVSSLLILVSFLAVVVFGCFVLAADRLAGSGGIYRGVGVGEAELGGLDRAEAREELGERASERLGEISLRGTGGAAIPAEEIGLRLDAAATAGRAYAVGREGPVYVRAWERLRAALWGLEVEPSVDYDRQAVHAEVERVAADLGKDAREPDILLGGVEELEGPSRVGIPGGGDGGYRVDVAETTRRAERAILDLSGEAEAAREETGPELDASEKERALERARRAVEEPLVLAHEGRRWTLSPDLVAATLRLSESGVGIDRERLGGEISASLAALERSPVDARLVSENGGVEVEPAEEGRKIRLQRLLDRIEAGIFGGKHRYEVPVKPVEPGLGTEEAMAARPNTMLGEFKTGYRVYDEPARVENLRTASKAVDGTVLAPGETFSFNEAAAPLSRYEPSAVIVSGGISTAPGGGLCQVASTLYMAANYAGLGVVERHPHSAELPYIRPGFDATVWFGSLDLELRNNTGGYLLLEEKVDEDSGEVVARVYGQPTDREVELSSEKVAESGGQTRWRSTRKVTEDGRVVESGTLNTDSYEPLEPQAPAPTGRGA